LLARSGDRVEFALEPGPEQGVAAVRDFTDGALAR
jgi:hypothetical protein